MEFRNLGLGLALALALALAACGGVSAEDCSSLTCGANATCTEGPPPACVCNAGYSGDGMTCTDVDECTLGGNTCDPNASCTDTDGGFTCECDPGYTGDGMTCTDDDECAPGGGSNCDPNATCTNIGGGFTCECNTGYSGDGTTCADIDECGPGGGDTCDPNAACTNTDGGFTCACNLGYSGDGMTCIDDDECLTDPCDANATCDNLPGTFSCSCDPGWFGDGFVCLESIGQVIWLGHDMFARNADVDRIIGNSVLQATTLGDVQVISYDEYADLTPGGEVENTDAAIQARATELGRTVTITRVSAVSSIPAQLATADVFLIYEMENGGDPVAIAGLLAPSLHAFLADGGVIIVMDHFTSGWQVLDSAAVMRFLGNYTTYGDTPISVRVPGDPIMADVSTPTYTGTNGTGSYYTNDGTIVAVDASGVPVVVHKYLKPRFSGGVSAGGAWAARASNSEGNYSLMTDAPAHIPDIYNMYDTTGQRYSPATDAWTPLVSVGPAANPWFQLAPVGMALYGWVAYTTQLWRYSTATDTWTNLATFPGGGTNEYSMAVADEAGVVYGYVSNGNVVAYNPLTNAITTYATAIPAIRGSGSLFETRLAYDPGTRSLYLGSFGSPELYQFDLGSLTTTQLASIPEVQLNDIFCGDRAGHIYAAGGIGGTTMWMYDIAADLWSPIPAFPIDHSNNGSCVISDDGHLYTSSGGTDLYRIPLAR